MIDLSNIKILEFFQVKIVDSFSLIKMGNGHGEARLYIGSSHKNWDAFFDNYNINCFFSKKDLLDYLDTAKFEYEEQQQPYINDIKHLWKENYNAVSRLNEQVFFNTANQTGKTDSARYYISFKKEICTLFRGLALPQMTSLLVQKIEYDGNHYIWFRPFLSELGNIFENEIIVQQEERIQENRILSITEKEQIVKARLGQGQFREGIIDKYHSCVITGIDDTRLLIASHIKPWSASDNQERLSRENGLLLSPTYDKLFDKGFISFKKDGTVILSSHLSDFNFSKAHLTSGTRYKLNISDKMKEHLEYHRDVIFLG